MRTNLHRLQQDMETIAQYSSTAKGGTTRFTFTKEHELAKNYITAQMKAAGLTVRQDAAGTLIGRREGLEPGAAAVMTGSHFDTVRCGGNFDGVAGVVAGLEAARVMQEQQIVTRRPLEFIAMVEEEGGRFGAALFASRAMAGEVTEQELQSLKDSDGISIWDAMKNFGMDPTAVKEAVRKPENLHAFIEMHIEQGPILEASKKDLGIVDVIVANRTLELTVIGHANHAGTTPMHMRTDAFVAAAQIAEAAMKEAIAVGEGTVATMGQMSVLPGSTNIIPGKVVFTLDIRSPKDELLDEIQQKIQNHMKSLEEKGQILKGTLRPLPGAAATKLDSHVMHLLEESADKLGFSRQRILSGAGHDAMVIANLTPTGMLFVPSKNGRSHCPEEWTDYEQLQKGCETLLETLIALANEKE
ncbi:MAG: Zn-dependent hydrolase [Lachnospiraceae bacterium]|jgi:allantoate deiminase